MWRFVAFSPDLLRPEFSIDEVRSLARRAEPNLAFYAAFTAFGLVVPRAAAFGYIVVAVLQVLRVRGDEAPAAGRCELIQAGARSRRSSPDRGDAGCPTARYQICAVRTGSLHPGNRLPKPLPYNQGVHSIETDRPIHPKGGARMRTSRFVVALVAVACAAALPAAAAANTGKPVEKSHPAKKGDHGWHKGKGDHKGVRLSPAAGQTAKGVADLKQHAGALSVGLVVAKLTPGAFYAAHVHTGTCAAPGAVSLTLPDIYANERGVAKLVTTVPTAAGANYLAGGFSIDVHAGPSASATPVISCGDIAAKVVKPEKSAAKAFLKGAAPSAATPSSSRRAATSRCGSSSAA